MAYTTIDDPSAFFQCEIWSGNGSTRSITLSGNSDLQPDMVWLKQRSGSENHNLYDSVRGAGVRLIPNLANSESTTNELTAFNSDGFSVTGGDEVNASSSTYVSWNWKAANGTASNEDGSITSTVSANTTSGFSVGTFTKSGDTTVGHGLGSTPSLIITRARNQSGDWRVWHSALGANEYINLNTTGAKATSTTIWQNTLPTSSVFSMGSLFDNVASVFYAFCEKQGYSKFGSYTGNGNANGPYIHLGFKPAFVIFKDTATRSWYLMDNKRDPENVVNNRLFPDAGDGDSTGLNVLDFLSNGIKIKTNDVSVNASGNTYTFISFAENPFVTSTGVPATAR